MEDTGEKWIDVAYYLLPEEEDSEIPVCKVDGWGVVNSYLDSKE